MSDPPPNSPIDIRAHVIYDAYQRISAEKSYKNYEKLCEAMGKQAISIEEYESLYNQYLEEDERDLPMPDVRGCILSDVINGKPAEKSIDDLCNAFNNDKIDKEDHGYWYKHFENGHIFTRVTFSDFPEDIVAEIVGKCDIKSYLDLRNVSSGLRAIVDQKAPPCIDMEVNWGYVYINVMVNDELVNVSYHSETANSNLPIEAIETQIPGTLSLLLSNPKLQLKSFKYSTLPIILEGFKNHFLDLLNSLDHKIHAEKFTINVAREKQVVEILQCFKPRSLEKIYLDGQFALIDINQIVEMDQWKQAKHLESVDLVLPPIEHLLHFSTIVARVYLIPQEDVVKLCKNLSKWTNYEPIKLEINDPSETEKESVKRALNLQPTATPNVYSTPNSNMVIQFEYDAW